MIVATKSRYSHLFITLKLEGNLCTKAVQFNDSMRVRVNIIKENMLKYELGRII